MNPRTGPLVAAVMAALAAPATARAETLRPATSVPPYLEPNPALPPGAVRTIPLLTVGDAVNGYRLVGVLDGLGVRSDGGRIDLLVNHELEGGDGIARAHGSAGSFVSRWTIDGATLALVGGRDLTARAEDVLSFDRASGAWRPGTVVWRNFCSGDLAPPTAFRHGRAGTSRAIYLTGEEARPRLFDDRADHGRAFAHVLMEGGGARSWELPGLGRMAFENVVASPHAQRKTIVVGLDDADLETDPARTPSPSELYVYVGRKRARGTDIERAGLTGGTLHGVRVVAAGARVPAESDDFGFGTAGFVGSARFELHRFGDVTRLTGRDLQSRSIAAGVTRFQRVEDGAWDPRDGFENDFYFVTTASRKRNSRLFRLRFDDLARPGSGGVIDIVLKGGEGHTMLDNLAIDPLGRMVILEDPGDAPRLAKVWLYDLADGDLIEVAAHSARFFSSPGGPDFLTVNEESSGVVAAFAELGPGWYFIDVQAHVARQEPELVEGGQLLALYIDPALGRRDHASGKGPRSRR